MSAVTTSETSPVKGTPGQPPVFALVGNPNCGKTTIFNALTGLRQKVANYPGVTVEKKIGECYSQHGKLLRLIDLPGAYSLNALSPDEAVLRDVLLGRRGDTPRPDGVICVVDAANIERNLYLVTQVLELGLPSVVALNMVDVAEGKQWRIDVAKLSEKLGVPVIPMQATTGKGVVDLKIEISKAALPVAHERTALLPGALRAELEATRDVLAKAGAIKSSATLLEPLYLLAEHDPTHQGIADAHLRQIQERREQIGRAFPGWEDALVGARYTAVGTLCREVLRRPENDPETHTDRLDRFLLHPLLGFVSFLAVMGLLFYLIFSAVEGPVAWIEGAFESLAEWVTTVMPEGDLRSLITDGVIAGVGGVVVFLPQILILFFFIGLMEDTGYMARIAFIMDWLMSKVGLNGKSFLPLLSSYACAVPGIMATRTIASPKDRLITILVSPLASCSARLPVYTLLIATMLPGDSVPAWQKAVLMISMYALGTAGAFFFAWLFNKGIMRGASSPMILEMPEYKWPALKTVLIHMWERASIFIRRAGTVILALSILIWAASTYPKSDSPDPSVQLANSFAGKAGHFIEPVIKPLGYDWKIGIGLIASFAAREVFNSTMGVIYAVESEGDDIAPLRDRVREETWPDGGAVYTPLVCLSLMVFYVFAMQCLSTVAVVRRETNGWRWPLFQLGYMSAAAYVLALVVYQVGRALGY
jgi:ferrous iron transport protein B